MSDLSKPSVKRDGSVHLGIFRIGLVRNIDAGLAGLPHLGGRVFQAFDKDGQNISSHSTRREAVAVIVHHWNVATGADQQTDEEPDASTIEDWTQAEPVEDPAELQSCITCGQTIVCPQVPSAGNPMTWQDADGNYGDSTHWHSPVVQAEPISDDVVAALASWKPDTTEFVIFDKADWLRIRAMVLDSGITVPADIDVLPVALDRNEAN
jgi:hypothetical protein